MAKETKEWYSSWFDTPFYHILYKDRGFEEAQTFMETLTAYLNISDGHEILDLACGKGRHSKYLSSIGYAVTGLDLSRESIDYAKQYENDNLHFAVHDMSKPYTKKFDAVFNLFTSFGYFENDEDNLNTIKAIKANLKPNGIGVIDFMNVDFVLNNLVTEEVKTIEDITFKLNRSFEKGHIIKDIAFTINGENYNYQERVKALKLEDFKSFFKSAGIELLEVFGDYKLNAFQKNNSERLIMIFM